MVQYAKLVGVLYGVIVAYIVAGTASNILVDGESFDWKKMLKGIGKAAVACGCIILLAYASTIVNIEGFDPNTFIKSGIAAYGVKLLARILNLLGIKKFGQVNVETLPTEVDKEEIKEAVNEAVSSVTERITEIAKDKVKEAIEETLTPVNKSTEEKTETVVG